MSAEIRRAGPEHWRACRDARLRALADAPHAFASTLERERGFDDEVWQQRLSATSAATFLAWQGDEVVGMATGVPDRADDEFAVPGAWQLVGMWVAPQARGRGIADRLVELVAGHAHASGAVSLVLWVTEVNARARAFYQRIGFVPTGRRQLVRPQEPDHWEIQMIRAFG